MLASRCLPFWAPGHRVEKVQESQVPPTHWAGIPRKDVRIRSLTCAGLQTLHSSSRMHQVVSVYSIKFSARGLDGWTSLLPSAPLSFSPSLLYLRPQSTL